MCDYSDRVPNIWQKIIEDYLKGEDLIIKIRQEEEEDESD